MSCFATGVSVVTLRNIDNQPAGLTINSLTSVSLEPPLILFCLDRRAHLYKSFRKSKYFAVNILGDEQEDISQHFAYAGQPKPNNMWNKPQGGCPVLKNTLGWMICKTGKIIKAGDHDIFLGEVVKLHKRAGNKKPLLYFHSRYHEIKE